MVGFFRKKQLKDTSIRNLRISNLVTFETSPEGADEVPLGFPSPGELSVV